MSDNESVSSIDEQTKPKPPPTKPKRKMTEKQLENLRRAREIRNEKMRQRKLEKQKNTKQPEHIEPIDKKPSKQKKQKITTKIIEPESSSEEEVEQIIVRPKRKSKRKKRIIKYESDSEEEIEKQYPNARVERNTQVYNDLYSKIFG